jgi:hypothetical protein
MDERDDEKAGEISAEQIHSLCGAFGVSLENLRGMRFLQSICPKFARPGELTRNEFTSSKIFFNQGADKGARPTPLDAEAALNNLAADTTALKLGDKALVSLAEYIFLFNVDTAGIRNCDSEMTLSLLDLVLEGSSKSPTINTIKKNLASFLSTRKAALAAFNLPDQVSVADFKSFVQFFAHYGSKGIDAIVKDAGSDDGSWAMVLDEFMNWLLEQSQKTTNEISP